jgi:hypothetical protein
MELVAMHIKSEGGLLSRTLSYQVSNLTLMSVLLNV